MRWKSSSGNQMGAIIAFIWKVGLLQWTGYSHFLPKKFELDFFFFWETSCLSVFINITELKDFIVKRSDNSDDWILWECAPHDSVVTTSMGWNDANKWEPAGPPGFRILVGRHPRKCQWLPSFKCLRRMLYHSIYCQVKAKFIHCTRAGELEKVERKERVNSDV